MHLHACIFARALQANPPILSVYRFRSGEGIPRGGREWRRPFVSTDPVHHDQLRFIVDGNGTRLRCAKCYEKKGKAILHSAVLTSVAVQLEAWRWRVTPAELAVPIFLCLIAT